MASRMRYVVCYDIPDQKRRSRLASRLEDFGDRVQESVFEAVLDRALLDQMMDRIAQVLLPAEDQVLVYPLCAECAGKVRRLGQCLPAPGEEVVFVV